MSRDDWENRGSLKPVFIEIGKGREPPPDNRAYVNVETFKECFASITDPKKPKFYDLDNLEEKYSIYATTCLPIVTGTVNIDAIPISRTFMGYLEGEILKEKLPETWKLLEE